MRRSCVYIMLYLLLAGVCSAQIRLDSAHVWHVADTGNNANGGHAQQYPIDLTADAFLTIATAVAAASDGDTIVVWPGSYSEQVDLSSLTGVRLSGAGAGTVITSAADGKTVTLGDDCIIEGMRIRNTGAASSNRGCIFAGSKDNIVIRNVVCDCNGTGIELKDIPNLLVADSFITGAEYGLEISDTGSGSDPNNITSGVVRNCVVKATKGWNICAVAALGVNMGGRVAIDNCVIEAWKATPSETYPVSGIFFLGTAKGDCCAAINNCTIIAKGYHTGYAYGIWGGWVVNGEAVARGCLIKGGTGQTNEYDLYAQAGAELTSFGSLLLYNTTGGSGTINIVGATLDSITAIVADTNDIQEDWAQVVADVNTTVTDVNAIYAKVMDPNDPNSLQSDMREYFMASTSWLTDMADIVRRVTKEVIEYYGLDHVNTGGIRDRADRGRKP